MNYEDTLYHYEAEIVRKFNEGVIDHDTAKQHLRTLGRWGEVAEQRGLLYIGEDE